MYNFIANLVRRSRINELENLYLWGIDPKFSGLEVMAFSITDETF